MCVPLVSEQQPGIGDPYRYVGSKWGWEVVGAECGSVVTIRTVSSTKNMSGRRVGSLSHGWGVADGQEPVTLHRGGRIFLHLLSLNP